MKNTRLIMLLATLAFSSSALSYDVFPNMIKPTAASPDGRYLVTKAPFAPHVVWQMPMGKPVFVASILSYRQGETPQHSGNMPLPPVITNSGWLITSSDGGQDPFGEMLVQASNIHTGEVQTLSDQRSCQVFPQQNDAVTLACFDVLESWALRNNSWQRVAKFHAPDYVTAFETSAGNNRHLFTSDYVEGDISAEEEALLAANFGIHAFSLPNLKLDFTVPFDCCESSYFVAASGDDHVIWAERLPDQGNNGGGDYQEKIALFRLGGRNVKEAEEITQLTLGAFPHGTGDTDYHPQLSTDGRYLSGAFIDSRGKECPIYDLEERRLLCDAPYYRGLWLGKNHYASREPVGSANSSVSVRTFPTSGDNMPVFHPFFAEDLKPIIEEGKTLNNGAFQGLKALPFSFANGVVARQPQDFVRFSERDDEGLNPFSGRVLGLTFVNDHIVWLDVESHEEQTATKTRYLVYRIGENEAARWVIVAQLHS